MANKIYTAACLAAEMGRLDPTVQEMRDFLESKGVDRHTQIEIPSYDAVVITIDGVIYGYKRIAEQKDGNKTLSLFGGTLLGTFTEKQVATKIAENFSSKTPVTGLVPEQVQVLRNTKWSGEFTYANGDQTYFNRYGAVLFLNDAQEEELVHGDKEEFHHQLVNLEKLNHRREDLWDYQQEMYADILQITGIQE